MLFRAISFAALTVVVACSEVPTAAEPVTDVAARYAAVPSGTQFEVWTTTIQLLVDDMFVVNDFVAAPHPLCVEFAGRGTAVMTGRGNGGQHLFEFGIELPPGTRFRLVQQHINCSGGFRFTAEVI